MVQEETLSGAQFELLQSFSFFFFLSRVDQLGWDEAYNNDVS